MRENIYQGGFLDTLCTTDSFLMMPCPNQAKVSPIMAVDFSQQYFHSLGLPRMTAHIQTFSC